MIKKRNQPISGARPEYSRKRPLVPEANATSENAQEMIDEAPSPFKNRMQVPQIPAPTNPTYRSSSNLSQFARSTVDRSRTLSIREMQDPNVGAVGYERGATKPKAGNPVISGTPTRGGKRMSGDINLPKTVKVQQFKTNRDIFSPRVLHEAGLSKL